MILLPTPRHLETHPERHPWSACVRLGDAAERFPAAAAALDRFRAEAGSRGFDLRVVESPGGAPEAYALRSDGDGVEARAADARGLRHALATLAQIVARHPDARPAFRVEDAPARARRGYLLDLSRDRVPTLATLRELLRELASLKYNELQLYTEHTFAYPGHEQVWGLASPLTPEEVRQLDDWAEAEGIELVPCLNTMGHFERWLRHPEYFALAECPHGWCRPDGHGLPWGSTLAPLPESLAFLRELMAAYLPLFRSSRVNIGGDEPWELGMGRSRASVEGEGRHRVYARFLREIIALAHEHKQEVQYWGDIIVENPAVWSPPPPGTLALVWGYEAGHPFADHAKALAAQGQPSRLCPGTSTWNSLGTRLGNALRNIAEAAACAEAHALPGLLLTDWGDHGHHQPPTLSRPALHAFAQAAWNPHAPPPPWAETLARYAFPGEDAVLGEILLELGELGATFTHRPPNRLPLAQLPATPRDRLDAVAADLPSAEVEAAEHALGRLLTRLPASGAPSLAHREVRWTLEILRHGARRLLAHRRHDDAAIPGLRAAMTRLIGEFEALWIARHRVGGLHESSGRLRAALDSHPRPRPAWPPAPR
jgi:hexosaminidase